MTKVALKDEHEKLVSTPKDPSYRHLPWLRLPKPVKALFDRFPLHIYERNELPRARIGSGKSYTLYVFTTEDDAQIGAPSFNPTCLKWQAYLRFCGIDFETQPSSNHASPSGALPFLLSSSNQDEKIAPIPTRQLRAWAERQQAKGDARSGTNKMGRSDSSNEPGALAELRYEVYMSLLDNRVRSAYLHALYIDNANFDSITRPLYVDSMTTSASVRVAQAHQLRSIARAELLKQNDNIDAQSIYRECGSAFEALSTLLGDSPFFEGNEKPGFLDAAVFGYTHLLLNSKLQWKQATMKESVEKHQNLVDHQERILKTFFSVS